MSAGWAAAAQAATELVGMGMQMHGAREQNKAQEQQLNMQFDFADEQGSISRAYNAQQAAIARQFDDEQGSITRAFNASEAEKTRLFSQRMASTQYQRAMGDLRKAGLNPMLAYSQGGAPMPAAPAATGSNVHGAAASSSPVSAPGGYPKANIAQQGLAGAAAAASLANIAADTLLKREQANKEAATASSLAQGETESRQRIMKMNEEIATMRSEQATNLWRQAVMEAQKALMVMETKVQEGHITGVEAQTALTKVQTLLHQLELPAAKNAAHAEESWWMENVKPYLKSVQDAVGIVGGAIGGAAAGAIMRQRGKDYRDRTDVMRDNNSHREYRRQEYIERNRYRDHR